MTIQDQESSTSRFGWIQERFFGLLMFVGLAYWMTECGGYDQICKLFGKLKFHQYDCKILSEEVVGSEIQNVFGRKIQILMFRDYKFVSKTKSKLACQGIAITSGGEQSIFFSLEDLGKKLLYHVELLD